MCEIKRINILKSRQQKIIETFNSVDPLSVLPKNYVSETGLTYSDISDKIKKISECASIIELRESFIEDKKNHTFEQVMKIAAANYCKQHTICPVCADRLQSRRRARFNDPIRSQARMVTEGARYAYLVTYTVADGPNLGERLEHLKESKKAFRKMGQKRQEETRSKGEAGKIKAAVSTIEIKRGKNSKEWHTHCHDLVFTDKPFDFRIYDPVKVQELRRSYGKNIPEHIMRNAAFRLIKFKGKVVPVSKTSFEWYMATDGDSMNIQIDAIRHVPKNAHGKKKRMFEKMSFEDSVAYQAKEVLKYITKPSESNLADSLIILNETYNKRMVATYGQFRGVKGDDYLSDPEPESESFVMVWKDGKYQDPKPGKHRDNDDDPDATDTRSKVGKILGEYRRKRRQYIDKRDQIGSDLAFMLDELKQMYKSRVSAIWKLYRNKKSAEIAIKNANCDKYSPVMALAGFYLPGSDTRDIYQAVFT